MNLHRFLPCWLLFALRHGVGTLLAILLALPSALHAQSADPESDNLIQASAYWEDRGGQADLAQAQRQVYTPYSGMFSRGYTASAHWIRLSLAASDKPMILFIHPSWLDHITLYDPGNSASSVVLGDRHPEQPSAFPGLGFSARLPPSPSPREIWLHLESTSSHVLVAQAIPVEQAPYDNAQRILGATLYSTALLLIFLLLFFIWLSQPERVLGLYLIRHAFFTSYAVLYLGIPRLLISGPSLLAWLDPLFSFLAVTVLPLCIPFEIAFLRGFRPRPFMLRLLQLLMGLGGAAMLAVMLGHARLALQANMWILATLLLLLLATALTTRPAPEAEAIMRRKVLLAYYVLLLGSLTPGVLSLLGYFQPKGWELYGWILHILISGVMMSVMLLVRSQRLARQSQQAQWALHKSQLEVSYEQRRREEQSQFLHMLMHELKTPLSVVSLALGTSAKHPENLGHASRAVQDMKAIIERCVQADQMGELSLRQRTQRLDVKALVAQIAQEVPQLAPRLQITSGSDPLEIDTDAQFLHIILTNLLYNAQRYSDPLTPITVDIAHLDKAGETGLAIRVANTPGLAGWPDEQQLFEKYYRSPGAQSQTGSGLGLFLSRQLAQSLGGTLEFAPSAQHVEFIQWIPLTPPAPPA